jgi:NAD(P) transhydrogenase
MTVTNPQRTSVPPPAAQTFDLVVIGAGPAGEKAAAQAAYFGKSVAIVEMAEHPGGAAVHTGTLPSKTLRESALYLSGHRARHLYGVAVELSKEATTETLQRRTVAIAAAESGRIRANLERHGVKYFHGRGRFEDAHTLRVDPLPNAEGVPSTEKPTLLKGHYFLVSTGSEPARPKIVPFSSNRVHDTDEIVRMQEVPPTLVILGAGVVGCEYACMFAALGTKVTLVDTRAQIMPFLDREMVSRLVAAMQRLGVEFIPATKWGAIHAFDDLVTVELADGRVLDTDHLLYAAGRTGRSWNLGLEHIGIMPDGRGYIPVDDAFQTEVSHILAAGDVIGPPALASTSMEQGRVAVCRAFGFEYKQAVATMLPFGVYTIPEISCVGETEASATKKGLDFVVGRSLYAENARGLITGDVEGMTKLLVDRTTRKILGVHVIGERASELVHIGQTAMAAGAAFDVFIEMIFNYPTLAESYKYAAYDALGKLTP